MTTKETQPITPLMANIVTKMFEDSAATTDRLIDNLNAQLDSTQAELNLIRSAILKLCSEKYMPNPEYIKDALYPTVGEIREYLEKNKTDGNYSE